MVDNEFTTNELKTKIDDVYELVLTLSKRSRELTDGAAKLTSFDHYNKLTIATHEVMEGLLKPARKPNEEDLLFKINTKEEPEEENEEKNEEKNESENTEAEEKESEEALDKEEQENKKDKKNEEKNEEEKED